jgi:serine phosphatase RsbU (regulator of sigma subunit)/PAS domain-containing protein/anti-sigma regulatory factor (Ser/Thr protein kinase)
VSRAASTRTTRLPREAGAAALARRAVEHHAIGLDGRQLDTARLLVSELVTNALRHGEGDIALTIRLGGARVRFEVRDDGAGKLRRRENPGSDGGFGLNLVQDLASRWGVEADHARVWFELARAPDPPVAPPVPGASLLEAARSVLAPARWSAWAPIGVVLALVLTGLDAALGEVAALTALLVLPPLLCAVLGRWGDTAIVAMLSFVCAVAVSLASGADGSGPAVAVLLVALGGLLAVLVALLRAAAEVNLTRFRLLSGVADVGNEASDLDETVARLLGILAPAFADVCLLDTTTNAGRQQRLGVLAPGAESSELADALRRRAPSAPDAPIGPSRAIARGQSQLVTRFEDDLLAAVAHDVADLELLRSLRLRSAIFVPLRARGHTIGALSALVGRSGRTYISHDLAFAELFAGRAAIALDNAGLTSELSAVERQLDAVLDGLAEAVTVMDAAGQPIYANDAAVELLRLRDAQELYDAPPGATMDRFAVYDEAGEPVSLEQLPGYRALAGEREPEPLLVRNVVKATGEERWLLNKTTSIRDAEGQVVRVVNVIEDVTESKRAELAQRLLAEASDALASSLDYERTLQRVAEVAVPVLADWCGVDLPGPDGLVRSVAVAHVDPRKMALARQLRARYPVPIDSPGALSVVIRGGPSVVIEHLPDEDVVAYAQDAEHLAMLRAAGLRSLMIVPLLAGGETLGALTLARSNPIRTFDAADLELAEELARRAGTAVLNARLYTEHATIAATLQRGLRPPELRPMGGFEAATLYRAAGELNEVGGDFFDAFPADGGWMLVVGDVAGQGAEAAALTALARYTLRSSGQLTGDPARAVEQLNVTLRDLPQLSLCSAVCALLQIRDPHTALMTFANCGHPLPVLLRDGGVQTHGDPGPMAGAFDRGAWPCTEIDLREGDTLLLYTDGVLDTVGEDERFGEQRLLETLRGAPTEPDALIAHLAGVLDAFQHGPQRDDTAVVALRFTGASSG